MNDISSTRESIIKDLDAQADFWRSEMQARIERFNQVNDSTKKLLEKSDSLSEISLVLQRDAVLSW